MHTSVKSVKTQEALKEYFSWLQLQVAGNAENLHIA